MGISGMVATVSNGDLLYIDGSTGEVVIDKKVDSRAGYFQGTINYKCRKK